MPTVFTDPSGLFTISFGMFGELYIGFLHFQVQIEIALGWSWKKGFSGGMVFTGGAQLGLGLGGGVGICGSATNADSVGNLAGWTHYVGVSTPFGGVDAILEDEYKGFAVSYGPSVGWGVHVGALSTSVWEWF